MKYLLCFVLPAIWSISAGAAHYRLNDQSILTSSSGAIALTGSFAADFSLGIPPPSLDGRIEYLLSNFELRAGGQSYESEEFDVDYMPFIIRASNVLVDTNFLGFGGYIKPALSRIDLQIEQVEAANDYSIFRMLSLIPTPFEDDGYSRVDVGEDGIPTFIQLGYGLHEIIMRVEEAPSLVESGSGTPSLIGSPTPAYRFITQSDATIGYLSIKASPVPLPFSAWLFGSALIGLCSFKRKCLLSTRCPVSRS